MAFFTNVCSFFKAEFFSLFSETVGKRTEHCSPREKFSWTVLRPLKLLGLFDGFGWRPFLFNNHALWTKPTTSSPFPPSFPTDFYRTGLEFPRWENQLNNIPFLIVETNNELRKLLFLLRLLWTVLSVCELLSFSQWSEPRDVLLSEM